MSENAFHVLDLAVDATVAEVRRAAAQWLARLDAGDPAAATYATPVGPRPRTAALVRLAAARLRDPDERVQHEVAFLSAVEDAAQPRSLDDEGPGWPGAPRAFGWRSR